MNFASLKFGSPSFNSLLFLVILACIGHQAAAQTVVALGTAKSFAVLGGASVVNSGSTILSGDLGVSPGASITGFPPGIVTGGAIYINDAVAIQAHNDAVTAYNQLAGFTPTANLTGQNLGGLTLTQGVYFYSAAAAFTSGILTLDGQNQAAPLFVFQIGSTLNTTGTTSFNFINGATASDVWFQVGSSATLGLNTAFAGTIISLVSDTLLTGVSVKGRIIALTGTVTLDSNVITNVPEPATTALLVSAFAAIAVCVLRRRNAAT